MIDGSFVIAGAVTGCVVGLTGVGGGALMTPILILFFGIAPATAVATDLWFAPLTKLAAVAIHQRGGNVDWQVVRRLWMGSIPVAIAVVVLMAVGMRLERFKERQGGLTVFAGSVLGLLVALTSVGAGALGTVMLVAIYPLRMTPHRLVATDIAHAIPLAMVAGTGYLFAGLVDGAMLFSLLLGSVPAVIAGSIAAGWCSPKWLRLVLAMVLLAVAAKTLTA